MKLARLIPAFVLIFTWSFLGGWITIFARYWIWVTLGGILVIRLAPTFFSSKQFLFLAFYGLIIILNYLNGDHYYNSIVKVIFEIMLLVFSGGLCYIFTNTNINFRIIKIILFIGAFVIIFTSIGTYLADKMFPDIVRTMVTYANNGIPIAPYYRMGVCDYNMPHAMPILIPPLIMMIKKKDIAKSIRILCVIVLIFALLLVYTSGATTPLIISLFALLCSLLANPQKKLKANMSLLIIAAIIAIPALNKDVQLSVVHFFERLLPEENQNQSKLRDIESTIIYGETTGDMEAREDLYSQSLSTFQDNILIGSNAGTGGHSILLDRLGTLGVVGIIPYLLFIWFILKSVFLRIPESNRFFFIIGVFCFLLTIATKNMGGIWMWMAICVFLPVMLLPQTDQIIKNK